MKRVLMIAFHFPPAAIGSGHLRTLGFVRSLPELGWDPVVLSANAVSLPRIDAENLKLIPPGCRVHRAFALDVRRHLSIRGKYFGFLAQPDGWASWWPAAVLQGLRLIRTQQIDVIWSTYPIMTAHCIAHTLSRLSGLPWVADFRDPVASSVGTENRFSITSQNRWEQRVAAKAAHTVFTTRGAMLGYAAHYPEAEREGRLSVIPNGYDEATFADIPAVTVRQPGMPLTLLHSGIMYPDGRNPLPFFKAVANLKAAGRLLEGDVRIVLRASGSEAAYGKELCRLGLDRMITFAPPVSSRDALVEQAKADALLLFQGGRFDHQIPAKTYEYLRIGRPIFALVGAKGDTAALLHKTGGAQMVPIDDVPAIERGLADFIDALRAGRAQVVAGRLVKEYSRHQGAVALADLFNRVDRASRGGIRAG
ncbi:glycosyltransferase [Rhodanobacter sp. Root627]|uniref:glycosyltransferase n=1 Tax=Rhodanobacter sp. Root627 TaxID=1736572 RepID=UPI000B2E9054|nr:glycosyltransferase [Rhodanobacter sp. Root627]